MTGLNEEQFMDILKYVYQDPYDFIFMNMDGPYDTMYHGNFNTMVIDEVWKKNLQTLSIDDNFLKNFLRHYQTHEDSRRFARSMTS